MDYYTDLTFYQMKILQSLKAERDRRNSSDNDNWFIKYIRGSLTLAQKKLIHGSSSSHP